MIDFTICILFIIHILLWLFCLFGGLFSIVFLKIIIFLLIPFIYLIHMLPYHIFEKQKIINISENIEYYKNKHINEINNINDDDMYFYQGNFIHCFPENMSKENIILITKIYICEENNFIFPKLLRKIRKIFINSYFNPFSAQGMMILTYIINIYLLKYKYKVIM